MSTSFTPVPPSPPPSEASRLYMERLLSYKENVADLDRRDDIIAMIRLAFAVAFAGCLGLRYMGWSGGIAGAITCVACFVVITFAHGRIAGTLSRAKRLVNFYQAGLRRINGGWEGKGVAGDRFVDPTHVYTGDLDIFGQGSLFELLCTARTQGGEETLASMLLMPADAETVRRRQRAVLELSPRLDLREDLAMLGQDVRSRIRPAGLAAWGNHPHMLTSTALRWVAVAITAATVVTGLGWIFLGLSYWWFLCAFIAGRVLEKSIQNDLVEVVTAIKKTSQEFEFLALVLARIEKEEFESEDLKGLKLALIRDGQTASSRLARLGTLTAYLDAMLNQVFALAAPLLLWTTHCAYAIEGWRLANGADVEQWIDVIGRLEAYASLGGYAYEHAERPYPEVVDSHEDVYFDGVRIGHPLISGAKVVKNDICIDSDKRLYIVSGSNMSGKSTLLRTIGINGVLAMAGAPVCADRLRFQPRAIGTSITTNDSLAGGVSRFYAEIKRLHQVVALAKSTPTLFLLDEVLHGTNSHDRRIGAEAILRTLSGTGAVGLATTHDLAISKIVDDEALAAVNVHFEDQMVDGRMAFDYHLREGVVEKSNALALMRAVGLEV